MRNSFDILVMIDIHPIDGVYLVLFPACDIALTLQSRVYLVNTAKGNGYTKEKIERNQEDFDIVCRCVFPEPIL